MSASLSHSAAVEPFLTMGQLNCALNRADTQLACVFGTHSAERTPTLADRRMTSLPVAVTAYRPRARLQVSVRVARSGDPSSTPVNGWSLAVGIGTVGGCASGVREDRQPIVPCSGSASRRCTDRDYGDGKRRHSARP